jgi:hypothetical protein
VVSTLRCSGTTAEHTYWRFNDREFTIDRANPAFPRAASQWWFGCPKLGGLNSLVNTRPGGQLGSFRVADTIESYDYVGDEDLDVESSDSASDNNSV